MSNNASLNHIYRTVWNESLGAMVAVAEVSNSAGKSTGSGARGRRRANLGPFSHGGIRALAFSIAVAWSAFGVPAWANPTGAKVIVGQASLDYKGNRLLVTTQNGVGVNHSAIDWQSFSIAPGQGTYFQQPGASSTSINRVVSNTPSQIFGTLGSNGKLVLVNQSGILVGNGAVVDTAAFTASALGMSDANALAGKLRFGDGSGAGVSVQGGILARSGDVVLLGLDVSTSKDALIQAPNGSIILAAGQRIALTGPGLEGIVLEVQAPDNGVLNLGSLQGDAVGVFGGSLKHSGAIQANAVSLEGGRVFLKALDRATVDGSVTAQRADGSGGRVEVRARDIVIGADARISVDAQQQGDGGRVLVLADNSTQFDGSIGARGGVLGGNGGFVETSGTQLKVGESARVSTGAPQGRVGTWLLDPTDFTIANTGGDITPATLQAGLALNDVIVQSSAGASGTSGDVIVNNDVSWSANKLTLNAFNNIRINSVMTASGGASLALEYGQGAPVAGNTSQIVTGSSGKVNLLASTVFTTKFGAGGADKSYIVIDSFGPDRSPTGDSQLQKIQFAIQADPANASLNYALGTDLDASASSGSSINWNYGEGFAPITGFNGNFEGLGHTISALTVNLPNTTGAGLFASTGVNATVRNVGLTGALVRGLGSVGGVVGENQGLVFNSYVSGSTVFGNNGSAGSDIGGLVGKNNGGFVIQSYVNTGSVTASVGTNVGGLVGSSVGSQAKVTNSNASTTVLGKSLVGGLVGFNDLATLENSHASGAVSGVTAATSVGGLVGGNTGLVTSTLGGSASNTYATGAVAVPSAGFDVGGLVGENRGGTVNNAYASGAVSAPTTGTVGGLVGGNYKNVNNAGGSITSSFATGQVQGQDKVGGLVGYDNSSIISSYATGAVSATSNVGGLVGQTDTSGASVSASYAAGNVSGSNNVGGLVGSSNGGVLANTYASGTVNASVNVGGLVGYSTGSVATSYASGAVTGSSDTGGLIGYNAGAAGSINNNHFLQDTGINATLSGIGYDAGPLLGPSNTDATPLTIAASTTLGSFSGWDITASGGGTSAWRIYAGNSMPLLRGLLKPLTLGSTSLAYNGSARTGATATGVSGSAATGTHVNGSPYSTGYWSTQLQGYDISGGSLTITPLTLTPTISNTGVTKVFDGTTTSTFTPTYTFAGLLTGDSAAALNSTAKVYDSAHVASATKVSVSGLSITGVTGSNGSLPGDYVLDATAKDVAATISARPLSSSASISPVAKTYDGTLAATGSTVSGSTSGAVGTDVVALNTNGLTLQYSNAHVAATGKTIGATGSASLGAVTSTGSGTRDGSSTNNLVVTLPGDYVLSGQTTVTPVAGTINAKTLTSSATINPVAKVYDGLTGASTSTVTATASGTLNGDSVVVDTSGLLLANNTAQAGATTIAASGSVSIASVTGGGVGTKDGTPGNAVAGAISDYVLGQPTFTNQNVAGTITPRSASNWLSSQSGLWSSASNWDVLPSTGNVLAANIPAGATVTFDNSAAGTTLQSINSLGTVAVSGSNLAVTGALSTANYNQTGGSVLGSGTFTVTDSFSQTAGSIAMNGAVSIRQASGNLAVGSISGSSIALEAVNGAVSQTAPLMTAGLLKVNATNGINLSNTGNSVSAFFANNTGSGNLQLVNAHALDVQGVTVANGNVAIDNTGAFSNSGPIVAKGGKVSITTHSPLSINSSVTAGGSITLAALTPDGTSNITINSPMTSTAGGISIQAYNNFIQNAGLNAALAIDVSTISGSLLFGPGAFSVGNPVTYAANGVTYVPPWVAAALSGGANDYVATFLSQFQDVLDAQTNPANDPLGLALRGREGVTVEGEICKP